jgi:hypothetical protein
MEISTFQKRPRGRPKKLALIKQVDQKEALFMAEKTDSPGKANGFALIKCSPRTSKLESPIVSVGFNGRPFNIERGKLVPVPMAVVEILDHATIPLYSDDELDPDSGRKKYIGQGHRYSYEVVKKLDQDQYDTLRGIAMKRDIVPQDLSALGL